MEVDISGARVFFTIPTNIPILGDLQISETLVVSWIVMALITGLCIWLTHDLKVEKISKRQAVAEMLVEMANKFVIGNAGEKFRKLIPFVAALFATSVVSNLISLIGLRSPTADLSTEAAWAIVVFIMITAQKIKTSGIGGYLKGFTTPIAVMTPFNVLSELATPISLACRHFGNILSGVVINALIYGALALGQQQAAGTASGRARRCAVADPDPVGRSSGDYVGLLRLVLRRDAGIYILYADGDVYRQRGRGISLVKLLKN